MLAFVLMGRLRSIHPLLRKKLGRGQLKVWGGRILTAFHDAVPVHRRPGVVVLCYHSIHPTSFVSCAAPRLFEKHLQWLTSECECVAFSEIPERMTGEPRSKPIVSVTFDDGYADNHEVALPLLLKWGVPATFFVTVGLVERDAAVLERFRALLRCADDQWRPMTWSQVRELQDAGMEIGAHTYGHPNLALLPRAQLRTELQRSKSVLEEKTGAEIAAMAYPFGKPRRHVNQQVADTTRDIGFRLAASIVHRRVHPSDSRFQLPRFTVVHDTIEKLRARVQGGFDIVGFGQEAGPLWAARIISPEDFRFGT
jgi:peptidoglycan/xylan/chitin deacetylase (PgdA/CDA1 family)